MLDRGSCLLLVLVYFVVESILCQSVKGRVMDEHGIGLVQASIMLKPLTADLILGFAASDDSGYFHIVIPADVSTDSFRIECRYIGYDPLITSISEVDTLYIFRLLPSNYLLGEVEIKAHGTGVRITGDTTTISPSVFSHGKEKNLKDILEKLPGVEINENDQILYNGKQVNYVHLDGDDFMSDQRGVLLRGLSAQDIDNVQFYRDISDGKEDLIMDVKTKGEAKNTLNMDAMIAAGFEDKISHKASLYSIGDRLKMFGTTKYNNTGEAVASLGDYLALVNLDNLAGNRIELPSAFRTQNMNFEGHQGFASVNMSWRIDSLQHLKGSVYGVFSSMEQSRLAIQSRANELFLRSDEASEQSFNNLGVNFHFTKVFNPRWDIAIDGSFNQEVKNNVQMAFQTNSISTDSVGQKSDEDNLRWSLDGCLTYHLADQIRLEYSTSIGHYAHCRNWGAKLSGPWEFDIGDSIYEFSALDQANATYGSYSRHEISLSFNGTGFRLATGLFLQSNTYDYRWHNSMISVDQSRSIGYDQLGWMLNTQFVWEGIHVGTRHVLNRNIGLLNSARWYLDSDVTLNYRVPNTALSFFLKARKGYRPYVYDDLPGSSIFENANSVVVDMSQIDKLTEEQSILVLTAYPLSTLGLRLWSSFSYSLTSQDLVRNSQFFPSYTFSTNTLNGEYESKRYNIGLDKRLFRIGLNIKYKLNLGQLSTIQFVEGSSSRAHFSNTVHSLSGQTTWKDSKWNLEMSWVHDKRMTLNGSSSFLEKDWKMLLLLAPIDDNGFLIKGGWDHYQSSYDNIQQWRWIASAEYPLSKHVTIGLEAFDFLHLARRERASLVESGLFRSEDVRRDFPGYILFTMRVH